MQGKPSASDLHFEFLPNPAEEDEGLGHAGIQTYRNEPYAGTARETGQNSRDAAASLPVRIRYDLLDVPRQAIPAIDELQSIVQRCLEQSEDKEKEAGFFRQALRVISHDTFKVLRIADFNTTGALGPSQKGKPFHSLLKASGVSVKTFDASGGSFGIGKNAVFAVSDLQTVFYSTVYEDHGGKHFLAQGKSILVSHTGADGKPRRQTGYWGMPNFSPISEVADVPEWLQRQDTGTSVFSLAFRDTPDWMHRISYSLIQNFFSAIHAGEMEFSLDRGRFEISKASLGSWFDDEGILEFVRANDRQQEFELSRSLYRCLVSPDAKEDIIEVPSLGPVKIRILVAEGLPKKVIIIRNGMVITDSLAHFGDAFARFSMYSDFVALVTPISSHGSAFIKRLEDPRHRDLSPEGLPDTASREQAKTVMKRLARKIRDTIKEYTLVKHESEVSLDEMRRYFAADSESSTDPKTGAEEDPERLRYRVERRKDNRRPQAAGEGDGGTGGGVGGEEPGPGPRPTPRPGPPNPAPKPRPDGPGGPGAIRPVFLQGLRNIRPAGAGAKYRTIYFTPDEGGDVDIVLQATGLNETETLTVHTASDAVVTDGKISRQVTAGERVRIDVEFDDEYDGPIEVRVNIGGGSAEVENENK
jgi:hypothetical protein